MSVGFTPIPPGQSFAEDPYHGDIFAKVTGPKVRPPAAKALLAASAVVVDVDQDMAKAARDKMQAGKRV